MYLEDVQTGERLTLRAEGSPLVLGTVEMSMQWNPQALAPRGAEVSCSDISGESQDCTPREALEVMESERVEGSPMQTPEVLNQRIGDLLEEHRQQLGLRAWQGEASEDEEPLPNQVLPSGEAALMRRLLESPIEQLSEGDFEKGFEILANRRNAIEGELEYLEEIQANESAFEAGQSKLDALDEMMGSVIKRKSAFDQALPKIGL